MKKLTAGILASLIGLVSANSADAAVASKAYVDGAIETLDSAQAYGDKATDSLKYIKYVNEVDGVLDAAEGTLSKVATTGDYADLDTKLTVTSDGTTGNVVTGVELSEDGNSVVVTKGDAANTTYAFEDTATVDFTQEAELDDNGNVVIKADVKPGKGLKIDTDGKLVTSVKGEGHVEIEYNDAGELVITGTDTTKSGPDVEVAEDGTVETKYYNTKNVDGKGAAEGWYALTRKCSNVAADGSLTETSVCEYQWELVDRSYDAGDWDVAHNEGTQPAQQ